ncbi:2-keto-3-deoxy-phosphogluconate aldolase [Rubrobacter xylanophilus DSM 9941]|uniref:2-keto-3-deoxy-phosphogluconate aldolase n=1 Tax=Rubrobacter xylanophilus (strain DSM 9941 / JCM 11954 / NBRC 16129 / PRD-1) TaxID=266117 RepID=Q1AZW8_RUBXD|nr:bifunctional 4-hydroxy-2-oxoglutarate aldolase/2-dehydro-3-deoxy-phosphogluconate aldolase [Rubrobacter xylanophilus]ABG03060.1 2-keto-3-deoxy-phosphogluconate aldolase [Rubrobacter xylanophilus DSM 9941]
MDGGGALERLGRLGLVAVVRGRSWEDAVEVSEALAEGGVAAIEVAYTTPGAGRAIRELARRRGDGILLGAGTLTSPGQAEEAAESGASFLVSPGFDPGLVSAMLRTGRAALPGVLTPGEVMGALRLGVGALKLFPAGAVGPGYLRALLGPFPGVRFVPTGGVSERNAGEWFGAGAFAVGAGGALAPPRLRDGRHREEVVGLARRFAAAVERAREGARR